MTYWVLTSIWGCPVCGRERTEKRRIYDRPKPTDVAQRYEWNVSYDYCDV